MPTSSMQPVRLGALAAATTLLVACGGGSDTPPQLGAATGASFTGACAGLHFVKGRFHGEGAPGPDELATFAPPTGAAACQ